MVTGMPVSPYITRLRTHIGHDLLLLPGVSAVVRNARGQVLCARRSDNGRWSLSRLASSTRANNPRDAVLREVS